jgi:hypothetical protein
VYADDHRWAGHLVLNVITGDRLVADAAFCATARAPVEMTIRERPKLLIDRLGIRPTRMSCDTTRSN